MRGAKSFVSVIRVQKRDLDRRDCKAFGAVVFAVYFCTCLAALSPTSAMQPPNGGAVRQVQETTGAGAIDAIKQAADYLPWNRAEIEELRATTDELEALNTEVKKNLTILAPRCDALFVRGAFTSDPLARIWNALRSTSIDSQIAGIRRRTGDAPATDASRGQSAEDAATDLPTMLEWAKRQVVILQKYVLPYMQLITRELQEQPAFNPAECKELAEQVDITGNGPGPYGWVLSKEAKVKTFCDGHVRLRQSLARHDYAFSLVWFKARETWSFAVLYDAARSFDFWYAMATNPERYGKSIHFRPLDKNVFPKTSPQTQELWREFRSFVQGEYFFVPASSQQYADVGVPDPRDDMARFMREISPDPRYPVSPLFENPTLGRPSSPGFADPVDSVLLQPNLSGQPGPIALETLQELANPQGNVLISRAQPPIEFATKWLGYYFLTHEEAASFGAASPVIQPDSQVIATTTPYSDPHVASNASAPPPAANNEAEARAVTKAWLQVFIDSGSEVLERCDQAAQAVTDWEEQIETLLTNGDGKFIAADTDSVRLFRAVYSESRPTRKDAQTIRASTEAILAPAKEAFADESKLYRPSDEANELLSRHKNQLQEFLDAYAEHQGAILSVSSSAKSTSTPGSVTLKQAIAQLEANEAKQRVQAIADAKETARKEADAKLAKAEAAKVKQDAENEATRIHIESETRRVEAENAAVKARDDDDRMKRLARAKTVEVQARLKPFFAKGYWQPGDKKLSGIEFKAMSLAAIREFGALEYSSDGLQKLLSLGCGMRPQGGRSGNDRTDLWGFPSRFRNLKPNQIEELKVAQKDLIELGDALVELGMLAP